MSDLLSNGSDRSPFTVRVRLALWAPWDRLRGRDEISHLRSALARIEDMADPRKEPDGTLERASLVAAEALSDPRYLR